MRDTPLVLATLLLAALSIAAAVAQPSVRGQKVLVDDERVRVTESVFKPSEENPMLHRGYRVTRVLKGNTTVLRTHEDGKSETLEWKEGGVYVSPAGKTSTKNVGNSEVTIYTVVLKRE